MPTHPLQPPPLPPAGWGQLSECLPSNSDLFLKLFPTLLSQEVKALGAPWGLTVKWTHKPVPRELVEGGREDMVDLNRVTFAFSAFLVTQSLTV